MVAYMNYTWGLEWTLGSIEVHRIELYGDGNRSYCLEKSQTQIGNEMKLDNFGQYWKSVFLHWLIIYALI